MPIKYVHGDIFNSRCSVIVNPVNCRGVMGAGLALKFKQRYPEMYEQYVKDCQRGILDIDMPTLWKDRDHWVMNLATKRDWRNPSRLEYIALGLERFVSFYQDAGVQSIAFPKLGCGLGQLDWSEVKEIMEIYLTNLPIEVEIYI